MPDIEPKTVRRTRDCGVISARASVFAATVASLFQQVTPLTLSTEAAGASALLGHQEQFAEDIDIGDGKYLPPAVEAFAPKGQPYFLHIPKNAGTTIEDSGFQQAGFKWGWHAWGSVVKLTMPDGHPCSWQHVPPDDLPDGNRSMYKDTEVFCITRHPYDRALSNYVWMVKLYPAVSDASKKLLEAHPLCSVAGLNHVLEQLSLAYLDGRKWLNDCHMLPQSKYVFGKKRQWCKHVIDIHELPTGFDDFMNKSGSDVKILETKNVNKDRCPGLSVTDINDTTLALLDNIYSDDFKKFNYTRANERKVPRLPDWVHYKSRTPSHDLKFYSAQVHAPRAHAAYLPHSSSVDAASLRKAA